MFRPVQSFRFNFLYNVKVSILIFQLFDVTDSVLSYCCNHYDYHTIIYFSKYFRSLGAVYHLLLLITKIGNYLSPQILLLFCIWRSWYFLILASILGRLLLRRGTICVLGLCIWFMSFGQRFLLVLIPDYWIFWSVKSYNSKF